MTEIRRRFKQALSTFRQNVESERSNVVQGKFKNKNKLSFWKVKKQNNKVKTANTIDGKTEDDDIAKFLVRNCLAFRMKMIIERKMTFY